MALTASALLVLAAGVAAGMGAWLWRQPDALRQMPWLPGLLVLLMLGLAMAAGRLWQYRDMRRVRRDAAQRDRILAGTNDGWWEFDLRTGVAFVSERWRQMHGLPPQAQTLREWWNLLPTTERRRVRVELRERLRDADCLYHQIEYRCVRPDGGEVWVLARGFFERGADGRARRMSGSASDISELKRAQRERTAARHLLRSIAAQVPGLVYQLRRWPDGSLELPYVSPAVEHLFGVTAQEASRDANALLGKLQPDDRAAFVASIEQSARELSHWQHEFHLVRSDGSERWLLGDARPQRAENGSVVWAGCITDISARKQQALALQDALRHTRAILDHMVDGMITIDVHGTITSVNPAAARIFGYERAELIGRPVNMLMPEPHRSHHDGYIRDYMGGGKPRVIGIGREVDGLRKDGSRFPMQLSVSRIQQQGEPVFIGLVQDISQRRRQEEEIHRLAYYDPLTGLPNRRLLLDRLQRALVASSRSARHGAVMFLDLDNFKVLNDTQGHDTGDRLLQQVAERLQRCVREADTVARLGGDEFVVLLEQLSTDVDEAVAQVEGVAAKVLRSLGQPYALGELHHRSTPSIGIVLFLRDDVSIDDLLKMADVAMYQAKAAGRNTTRFYDPAMQQAVAARAALEADMRRSLRERDFLLHYQPQVDRHGELMGVEALLRWNHPQRGMVSPAAFIPLAEEVGLITALGSWVLESACRQLVRWSRVPALAHCVVAVNVSAQQLAEPDFVDTVLGALARTGARADRLKLELTESMLAEDVEGAIAKMLALKARGVGFALDDFGTGYSSLSYLKRLPLDQLKIDCSFVRDLLVNSNAKVIARTIIGLGHSLGLSVIAEGVETEEQQAVLWRSGCDAFQGYLLGRPAPAEAVEQLLLPRVRGAQEKSHPQVASELVA